MKAVIHLKTLLLLQFQFKNLFHSGFQPQPQLVAHLAPNNILATHQCVKYDQINEKSIRFKAVITWPNLIKLLGTYLRALLS